MHYTSPEVYNHISKQTNDPIVERKTCEISGQEFPIFQSDIEFYDKVSPTFDGKKYQIPTPRLCPEERQRRRLLFRNERKLYKRKCDATGESIISIYSPDLPTGSLDNILKIYKQDFWWGDKSDKKSLDIDFEKTFLSQFMIISNLTPRIALNALENENSPYTSFTGYNKDCYLIYTADQNNSCLYGSYAIKNNTCLDFLHTNSSENSYEVIHCNNSYKCIYGLNIKNCDSCMFSFDLIGCNNCFLSYGLKNANYYFKNKIYSKDEYFRLISQYNFGEAKKERESLIKKYQGQNGINISCNDCRGEYLLESDHCYESNNITKSSNLKYCSFTYEMHNSMDRDFYGDNAEWGYECVSVAGNCHKTMCLTNSRSSSKNILYSDLCMSCEDCFACVGLQNKQYYIFNKQYTKKEYNDLVPKIIEKMITEGIRGEFFHPDLSPFGYNETVAQEYFPLTRQEALDKGYKRQDNNYDPIVPEHIQTLKGNQIPSDIFTVTEEIFKKILICEVSGRPFRIIKQELSFYKKHNLPLPRKHPDIRHEERIKIESYFKQRD